MKNEHSKTIVVEQLACCGDLLNYLEGLYLMCDVTRVSGIGPTG
jgi:hypothetical protein